MLLDLPVGRSYGTYPYSLEFGSMVARCSQRLSTLGAEKQP